MGIVKNGGFRGSKKHRIIWDKKTGEIISEIEDDSNSITLCWRDDIETFESNTKQSLLDKIAEKQLKGKDKVRQQ